MTSTKQPVLLAGPGRSHVYNIGGSIPSWPRRPSNSGDRQGLSLRLSAAEIVQGCTWVSRRSSSVPAGPCLRHQPAAGNPTFSNVGRPRKPRGADKEEWVRLRSFWGHFHAIEERLPSLLISFCARTDCLINIPRRRQNPPQHVPRQHHGFDREEHGGGVLPTALAAEPRPDRRRTPPPSLPPSSLNER